MISNLLLLLAFRSPNMPPLYSLKRKYRRSAAFRRSYFANWLDAKIKPFSINVAEELRQHPAKAPRARMHVGHATSIGTPLATSGRPKPCSNTSSRTQRFAERPGRADF